jgi:hypothetical protein
VTLGLGNYYFRAVYSGDSTHASAITNCGEEILAVRKAATLSTRVSANGRPAAAQIRVQPGSVLTAIARVLASGVTAGDAFGSVAYAVYNAASDPTCAKAPAGKLANAAVFGGVAAPFTRPSLPILAPGRWLIVASYSGDQQYEPAVSGCGSVVVTVRAAAIRLGRTRIVNGTIINRVTPNGTGQITLSGQITNPAALAARARRCPKGKVRLHGRCVSTAFGSSRVIVTKAKTITVKLRPNAAARRALARGLTLHVRETIRFRARGGGKPAVKTLHLTVRRHR